MTSVPSATTWGSPTASKHALLIHGLTSSSHTWHRVATSLAVQGYFVTAPNLAGHVSRVSPDYHFSSIVNDLRPYLEARNYDLVIGHSVGALTALHLVPHLPRSHPTAIVLVDPPLQHAPEGLNFVEGIFADSCINVKPAEEHGTENPLFTREDCIYRELGTRLCSVEAVRGILRHNRPWHFLDYFSMVSEKWKMTVMVADPALYKICCVEDIHPYPHIRSVMVPGAGHWIQYEFPGTIVDEALRTVAGLEVV